ncbi:post-transcriptional regulator [Gracilibacillus salinarum]|uniref:Post-transcriptional regulator n=1 Tax=Gracilibacillus salinarum TaxID=2932255 RepID=A0ABY4GP46_9BACI|nr:post-transcriptional regulator [Gracilibacillus salinarum]UOQ86125.1 post-transcriptional regulator [Gracilibacillus salinarum]
MVNRKQVSSWRNELDVVLESKMRELQLLDYSKTTIDDIWNCLVDKVWKGNPDKALYEVVQDILHLNPNIYMTYLTQKSWMDTNLQESLDALLGNRKSD